MNTVLIPNQKIYEGDLILVSPNYRYRSKCYTDLAVVADHGVSIQMHRPAARMLAMLINKLQSWDCIVPVSGWRSMKEQQKIWDDTLYEHGPAFTKKYVAVPGHSEHQTGLAIDLGRKQNHIDFICPEFPYSGVFSTFRAQAAHYGFIERYPAGKENITGIGHEPWHFRYVGIPHAEIIRNQNMVLEEYIALIKNYPHGSQPYLYHKDGIDIAISYAQANISGWTELAIPTKNPYAISGNNTDGFIITEWRNTHA